MTDPSPSPVLRPEAFLDDRRSLSREAFLAKHPLPVLVISLAPAGREVEHGGAFRTQLITSGLEGDVFAGLGPVAVVAIEKRMADAFQAFIWVGRESRCDVSLPFTSVSKLQAQFIKRAQGEYELLDAGSTNGTFVDGAQLEKNKPVPLRDGALVRFGKIDTRFRTADGFWEELGQRL